VKQAYKDFNFHEATLKLIVFMDRLISEYQAQGFVLSVRQVYYQLVARGMVPNTERSYKNVARVINDARLAGLLDWDAIEDRGRDVVGRQRWAGGGAILRAAADSFHMDQWVGQSHRVFVIVEKAALAGVLSGVCHKWDVPLLAARGYPSVSVVRELALDYLQPALMDGQTPVVLHLGDHDPSGIDMTRDLDERLELFMEEPVDLKRIALTISQIKAKKPPPNPAKTTDSRFKDYREKFGDESWELDALEPSFLVNLVEGHVKKLIDDQKAWDERTAEIEDVRNKLVNTAKKFKA
jgi:hypothetical protein